MVFRKSKMGRNCIEEEYINYIKYIEIINFTNDKNSDIVLV